MQGSVVEDARAAADWIARALQSSGYKADFSLESLREIDRFFEDQAPAGKIVPGGLLSESFGNRIFALGAYVGEVLRRKVGGEWVGDDSDPEAEYYISVRLDGHGVIWPMQRVFKRCKLGQEEGIYAYGFLLAGK